jgi:predicted  nucleic acid-binding Zn-ribbon protein
MLSVHEEKIARQEEALIATEDQIERRRNDLEKKIDELHSRITTNTKEIMGAAAIQHLEQNKEIQKIRDELSSRVGVLERWRWIIIGGSIIAGFIIQKYMIIGD